MNEKYENFDPEKLFALKDNYCGFKFCPLCGKNLEKAKLDFHFRLRCPDSECGYVFIKIQFLPPVLLLVKTKKSCR